MKAKATMADVAERAGVSTATVSRALSEPEKVSRKTRTAVQDAITATGYRMNMAARSLRLLQTRLILVLVPDLANTHFSKILEGVDSVFEANDFAMLINDRLARANHLTSERILRHLDPTRIDGVLVLDGSMVPAILKERKRIGALPIVYACDSSEAVDGPVFRVESGARAAVQHLVDLGHRGIGHVRGLKDHPITRTREDATRQTLRDNGLEIREEWFFDATFLFHAGYAAGRAFLELPLSNRPTAVFCCSDEIGIAFMAALQHGGLKIPEDVSVVGYDGLEMGLYLPSPLTTIVQPQREFGEQSALALLALLEGEIRPRGRTFTPQLVVRASTCPPKQ